jgi:hypothetical protein
MNHATFRLTSPRARILRVSFVAASLWAVATAPSASAAVLTPPPPTFEQCHAAGGQTICEGNRVFAGGLDPTGILCGSGPDAFEIYDNGGTVLEHAIRWYDGNGNLTRRLVTDTWLASAWTNPQAGTAVSYRQSSVVTDVLGVPGDLGSATETTTGVVNFVVPGSGAIVRDAGKTVFGFDGTLEFEAGPNAFVDYFINGDTTAFDPICSALAGS